MVVAGPGTGKTQILTLRIANILRKTDIEPSNILAVTFTESGVASMRERLVEMIGSAAYSVRITTFHGFCNEVIKEYPEYFKHLIGSEHITEVDQINILKEAIHNLPLKELRPYGDPEYYLLSILKAINDIKREGIDEKAFEKILLSDEKEFHGLDDLYHEKGAYKGQMKSQYQKLLKNIQKNKEILKIYSFYQKKLLKLRVYDYSDMIMEAVKEMDRNRELRLILQEQYQYVLVDEHQDTNNGQNRLLRLLTSFHDNPNLFIVGDEKQAIFRFQGASIENFSYFRKLYPKAKLIVLERNYRSGQKILDAAHHLLPSERKLRAKDNNARIYLSVFSKSDVEAYAIGLKIQERIERLKRDDLAVLYRDNKDVFNIARVLEKLGIHFVIESAQNVFSDSEIKKLILLLKTVSEFGSDEYLARALHIDFLGLESFDIYRLILISHKEKVPLYQLIKSKTLLDRHGFEKRDKIYSFYSNLSRWASLQKNVSLTEVFETVVKESGCLASILSSREGGVKLEYLNTIFNELKSLLDRKHDITLSEFLSYLEILDNHNLLSKKGGIDATGKVRLMTAHGAKGREFDCVFIINAFDGHWGNRRIYDRIILPEAIFSPSGSKIGQAGPDDDERRLFYVALTRAKKEVHLSYAREGTNGKEQVQSRFVSEIREDLIEGENTEPYERRYLRDQEIIYGPAKGNNAGIEDQEFIRQLFLKNGLSVTGLNNYLSCPWKYFYCNLLRIPEAKNKHQMYGTAVHGALKDFFEKYKQGKADKNFLLSRFEYYLRREPLIERDLDESLEKGRKALSGYYDASKSLWTKKILTEFRVPGIVLHKDLTVNGQIDKIEILKGKEVRVIDYKTSRPKTRKEIEGETLNSKGDIKRQLVFYKLLLDNYSNGKQFDMKEGAIEFIEPDQKGRYKRESFFIDSSDVKELKDLLQKTSQEILSLSFWDKFCDDKDCEYCKLRWLLK